MNNDLGRDYTISKWMRSVRNEPPKLQWRLALKNTAMVIGWIALLGYLKSFNSSRFSVADITPYSNDYYAQLNKELNVTPSRSGDGFFVEYRELPDVQFIVMAAGIAGFLVFTLSLLPKSSKPDNNSNNPRQ